MLTSRFSRTSTRARLYAAACCTCGSILLAAPSEASKDEAYKILKTMSDYVSSQKSISVKFDATIEVVTPDLEKIQFNNSGQILLVRPDKFRASRVGGYSDVELVFDGKTATLLGKHLNAFGELQSPGSTDELFARLRGEFGMQIPGSDLLLSDVFAELTKDVQQANHVGSGVIGGVECEHLAFRNDDTDWQLWVDAGPVPVPRKLVITSKAVTGGPQYTLLIRDWKTDGLDVTASFTFRAPDGAKKVGIGELTDIDEIPAGVVRGSNE